MPSRDIRTGAWLFFVNITLGEFILRGRLGLDMSPSLPDLPGSREVSFLTGLSGDPTLEQPPHPGKFAILAAARSRRNRACFAAENRPSTSVPGRRFPEYLSD
jgi:hypothetical protein